MWTILHKAIIKINKLFCAIVSVRYTYMFSASYCFIKEFFPRKMLFSHRLGLISKKKNTFSFLFFYKTGKIIKKLNKICSNYKFRKIVVVVLSFSHVWLFAIPLPAACQASLYFTISWSLLKLISIESVMPSKHLVLCRPPLLLPSIFPGIRVFSSESALCIMWPK